MLNADGTITVPAGVSSFTVTVPTVQDTAVESSETLPLTIDSSSVVGTILDDDKPAVVKIELAPPASPELAPGTVPEGTDLVYNVELSQPTTVETTYPFNLGGGSAAADDIGQPVFSNGVVLNTDGTINVPAGVTSFSVSVPTTQDTTIENSETVPLSIDGTEVIGTILDDDTPTVVKIELTPPASPDLAPGTVPEGTDLVYNVELSESTTGATVYPFNLGGGTAAADDIGQPVFSNGVVLNTDGTITVPAGVTSFSVTVPTTQDSTLESSETVPLSIDGTVATGTILDDDKPAVVKIELTPPASPELAPGTVPEGSDLVYNVELSEATTGASVYPFNLGGGTAAADDIGQPVFSNGVTLNTDGTITVPAGVTSFSVTVPTTQDATIENSETVPLNIDGTVATGTILDDDRPASSDKPTVVKVEVLPPADPAPGADPASVVEGADLVYNVELSQAPTTPVTYPFTLGGGTAVADDIGQPVFSNGVVLNADGTITVPAGVTSFSVTVPTTQDTATETSETVPLNIDGTAATGTIVDDDKPSVVKIELTPPASPDLAPGTVPEGTELVYNVELSQATTTPTVYPFNLGGGTAADDDIGQPVFSNGVVLNTDGTITVPAGVTTFSVTVPTTQDTTIEASETVPLMIDTVVASGTILDDDTPTGVDKPTVVKVEVTPPASPDAAPGTVPEGTDLVYNVELSQATTAPATYPFNLGGGTAAAGDIGQPVFSNGVVLNTDGTITVPAGVTRFSVSVPTTQDTTIEANETVPLSIDGTAATGTIIDDDKPTIQKIEPGPSALPGAEGGAVLEGENITYTVTLSEPAAVAVSYPFTLGGGSASAADFGKPSFSNGVVLNADGTITVPAGVGQFSVTVPSTEDDRVETTETVPLRIDGVAATGSIVDDDTAAVVFIEILPPSVPVVGLGSGEAVEGTALTYRVQLNQPTATETVYPFNLGGGSAAADDFGRPAFSDGVVFNADGTITVPAGVLSFQVVVPTTPDTVAELQESVPLTIDGVSATGLIIDDDQPVVVQIDMIPTMTPSGAVDGLAVTEGSDLVYSVKLDQATTADTVYPFSLGGGTAAADDFGTPVFSNGVKLNSDGTITVPPGVDSFTVKVATTQDTAVELAESAPLAIGGAVAVGSILDDDKPSVIKFEPTPQGRSGYRYRSGLGA